jgi:endonuclease/exonuclease/phosphatase family metal-dependent hydrolase
VTLRIIRFFAALISLLGLFIAVSALLTGSLGVRSALMSVGSLTMPIVLIINTFIFLFWLIIKSRWALVPVLTFLAGMPYLGSVVHFTSDKSTASIPTITLCTYNTHGFSYGTPSLTLKLFAEFVQQHNVNILCLQEMDETKHQLTDSLFKQHSRLVYHNTQPGTEPGFALTVYSAYPLVRSVTISFPKTDNHAMFADVLIGSDTIRVFNVHLQTTHFNQKKFKLSRGNWVWDAQGEMRKTFSLVEELTKNIKKRQTQADSIATLIEESPYPVIVCGDLNTLPASYSYWRFRHVLKDGFRTAGSGYEYTYRYLGNFFRIDYIFHHPDLDGSSYESFELDYSDHKPVIMSLTVNKRTRE